MEKWDWHGAKDGYFRFATGYDKQYIYLAVQTLADEVPIIESDIQSRQDKFILNILPGDTSGDNAAGQIELQLAQTGYSGNGENIVTEYAFRKINNNICAELKLLRSALEQDMEKFRLNIAWMDHDNPANTKPSVLWWRPPWNSSLSYEGSGIFFLR